MFKAILKTIAVNVGIAAIGFGSMYLYKRSETVQKGADKVFNTVGGMFKKKNCNCNPTVNNQ